MKTEMQPAVEWLEEPYDALFTPRYTSWCEVCDDTELDFPPESCTHQGTEYRPLVRFFCYAEFEALLNTGRVERGSGCPREIFEFIDEGRCTFPASEEMQFCGCYAYPMQVYSIPDPTEKELEQFTASGYIYRKRDRDYYDAFRKRAQEVADTLKTSKFTFEIDPDDLLELEDIA